MIESELAEIKGELSEMKGLLMALSPHSKLIPECAPLTPREIATQFYKLSDEQEIQTAISQLWKDKKGGKFKFLPRGRGYRCRLDQPYFQGEIVKKAPLRLRGSFLKSLSRVQG